MSEPEPDPEMSEPEPDPDSLARFIAALRQLAEDPDEREGALREGLRRAGQLLEAQHRLVETLSGSHRKLGRRLATLAILFALLAASEIARAAGWL